jgi:hypothetical protein
MEFGSTAIAETALVLSNRSAPSSADCSVGSRALAAMNPTGESCITKLYQHYISTSLPNVKWGAESTRAANRSVERSSHAAAEFGVGRSRLMWRAANKSESRHDQLPVARRVSICLSHARRETLFVRASVDHHLIDREQIRARTSRASAGDNTQNRPERTGDVQRRPLGAPGPPTGVWRCV